MTEISREQLSAWLDESLGESEMARIEKALRESPELLVRLNELREQRDRGEHTLGAIWRRDHLSCPNREQLSGFVHGVLEAKLMEYLAFHVGIVLCPACNANLDDLRQKLAEPVSQTTQRRKKIFDSSAGLLVKQDE